MKPICLVTAVLFVKEESAVVNWNWLRFKILDIPKNERSKVLRAETHVTNFVSSFTAAIFHP